MRANGGYGGSTIVFGVAFYGNSSIDGKGEGTFIAGGTLGYNTGSAEIATSKPGAWAGGTAAGTLGGLGSIRSEENGSFALGKAVNGDVHATEEGAHGLGVTLSGRNIRATSFGARAHGSARSAVSGDIIASAEGSSAIGFANGTSILASVANAVQYGMGSNSLADSFKVGDGCWMKGSLGAPASPVDGQFWRSVGGALYCRTGGLTKNLSNIP